MKRQINKSMLICGLLATAGVVQFVHAVSYAAAGSKDPYLVTEHFLSDLGRSDNAMSATIFNRGLILLGLSLVPFFGLLPHALNDFRWTMRIAGVSSCAGLIGIGLTPYDQHFVAHHVFLVMWIGPMLVLIVTFLVSAVSQGFAPLSLTVVTCLVILGITGYALVGSHSGHVVFQKLVAVLAVVWFGLVFASVTVSTVRSVSSRTLLVERQARKYLRSIQHNYRRR